MTFRNGGSLLNMHSKDNTMKYTNWWMHDENGAHAHSGCYWAVKRNKHTKLASKWMKQKKILSEVTQVQKDKCCMFSLIRGSSLWIFRCDYITWSKHCVRKVERNHAGKEREGAVDSSPIRHGCYDVRKGKHWGTWKGKEGNAEWERGSRDNTEDV